MEIVHVPGLPESACTANLNQACLRDAVARRLHILCEPKETREASKINHSRINSDKSIAVSGFLWAPSVLDMWSLCVNGVNVINTKLQVDVAS